MSETAAKAFDTARPATPNSNDRFRSRRSPALAVGGMAASSQPLATAAGMQILSAGGTAADAAVAIAAALQVTEPCSTGLGGDCFCLYYEAETKTVHGYNGSGRAPTGMTLSRIRAAGIKGDRFPNFHPFTVTVPGAPAGWADVTARFGRLPISRVLAPAVELAQEGFPIAPMTAAKWASGAEKQLSLYRHGGELTIEGRAPRTGERFQNPYLADALRIFVESGCEPFYQGSIAERIVEAVQEEGGLLSMDDLAAHHGEWVEPISLDYRGFRVWECPPNGQGLTALIALNILRRFDSDDLATGNPGRWHLLAEALRAAFADAVRYIADPAFGTVPVDRLLSEAYGSMRAASIDPSRRMDDPEPGRFDGFEITGPDTVYLAASDEYGNACSFINSNYMGFGTGIVPRGCGYSLQNRGHGFLLREGHPNAPEPGKRPYHTIIPGMITHEDTGGLYAAFGVMGGMMQPQGHTQVVSHLVDSGEDPQGALDLPRLQVRDGQPDGAIMLEDDAGDSAVRFLTDRGHPVETVSGERRGLFGLGQIVMPGPEGVWWGGSDPRGDGCAIGPAQIGGI